jgi:hypothetical protein
VSGAIAGYVTAARIELSFSCWGYRSASRRLRRRSPREYAAVVRGKRQSGLRSPELRDERNGQMSSRMRRLGSADG